MKWIFNPLMLASALAGLMIWWGLGELEEARHHTGSGYVHYEEPDRMERVSESVYRRHHEAAGVMLIFIGIAVWVAFAVSARDERRKKEAQERVQKLLDEERRKLS